MHNHQCPCCLRGTVPNDYCNTPAPEEATDFNHKREHIATTTTTAAVTATIWRNEEQQQRHTPYHTTPQNRKIPPSNELLQQLRTNSQQQSSKYFDVRCQNLAIYSVSDPLQINCCEQENSNSWHQSDRINQLSSVFRSQSTHHPSNINNQINCIRCHCCSCCCCCSYSSTHHNKCCFTTAALSPDNSFQSDSINNCKSCTTNTTSENHNNKIDENSLACSYISNLHQHDADVSCSDNRSDHCYFSVSYDDHNKYEQNNETSSSVGIETKNHRNKKSNENKMSSGDNNCRKNKKELGIWTEYTELLLGRSTNYNSRIKNNNSRKTRNLKIGSTTTKSTTAAITSIFSSVFLLITLLPSFTLAGGEYLNYFYFDFICF